MVTHVILLAGPLQAGKTTIALRLQMVHGFNRYRFADPIKDMIMATGLSREHVDGCRKNEPVDIFGGKTARYAMQTLGTEWRDMMDRHLWCNIIAARVSEDGHLIVVVDDYRFPHEVDPFQDGNFMVEVWRVWNSNKPYPFFRMWLARRWWGNLLGRWLGVGIHSSEAWWNTLPADVVIDNNGTLDELRRKVDTLVEELSPEGPTVEGGTRTVRLAAGAMRRD